MLAGSAASFGAPKAAAEFAAGRLLLKPAPGVGEAELHALLSARGAAEVDEIPQLGVRVIKLPAVALDHVLAALQNDHRLEFVERDPIAHANLTPNDPYFTGGSQWYLSKIQAPAAWDVSVGSATTVVAVLDTGVNFSHPDLQGKLLAGYDFVNYDGNPQDDHGHGTAVSGVVAAASNNGVGMASLAWSSPVLPVKVLAADGSGSHSTIAMGINYAADQGARVINLSLGGTTNSLTLQDAIDYAWSKGAVVVAAAGNSGNSIPSYPAACANVVAVSATNSGDTRPSWSNYGSYVDVAAPGESILSISGSGYGYVNGTSFSSPVTAGVAALMAAANPGLGNSQLVDLLQRNSDDIGAAGYDVYYGHGRVNASRAVAAAAGAVAADTILPLVAIHAPANGTAVSGTVLIETSATDNLGVVGMEILIDGVEVASGSAATLSYQWNTADFTDGSHTITARASDAANNIGSSAVSATVQNVTKADGTAPSVAITSPTDDASVSGLVKIAVGASDNVRVTRIELFIDGDLCGTSTSSSATFNWNTRKVNTGEHQLQAYAYDAAGNIGGSLVVKVVK